MPPQSIYQPAEFFLVRSSLFSYCSLPQSLDSLLEFYKMTPQFQEALIIASSSLHRSIQAFLAGKGGDIHNIHLSLLKYFLRSNSRATPFGLFSFVGWGNFSENSNLSCHLSSIQRKTKPDMEWIKTLTDQIHQQKDCVRLLKIITNPNLVKKNGRVKLRVINSDHTIDSVSIKSTPVSDFLFLSAKRSIYYNELEHLLVSKFCNQPATIVQDYLWKLFTKDFLLSELSFEINKGFSFDELINKIKRINPKILFPYLDEVQTAIEEYDHSELGNPSRLLHINDLLEKQSNINRPIQVDAFSPNGQFSLPQNVQSIIGEAVSIICSFSQQSNIESPLHKYHRSFLEKYGLYRLVPFLELIDDELGLGLPIRNDSQLHSSNQFWHRYSLNTRIIQLNEASIPPKAPNNPRSLEVFFELIAQSQNDIDTGNFLLVINPLVGSTQAGNAFGRFMYLWKDEKIQSLQAFLQKEEQLEESSLFVEASFLPISARSANVSCHEKLRQYQLPLHYHDASLNNLDLEDIYIGANESQLYIYSKRYRRELLVSLSSAITPDLAIPHLKLLLDITQSSHTRTFPCIWGEELSRPFLPRVSYKNIVLSPARWLLNDAIMNTSSESTHAEVQKAFEKSVLTFEIPELFYLTFFDQKLLINRNDPAQIQLLIQQFVKTREVILLEVVNPEYPKSVSTELGHHATEFVVPCVLKPEHYHSKKKYSYPTSDQIAPLDRTQIPGGEWLYLKIFINAENEEFFLINQISPLIRNLLNSQMIDDWFYVRYREERSHLRIRFHGTEKSICSQVIPMIYQQASYWLNGGMISDFSFHCYEREVERYGGPEAIEHAEKLFSYDSLVSLSIMETAQTNNFPMEIIAACNAIFFLKTFYPSGDDLLSFLANTDKSFLSGFRDKTNQALNWLDILCYEAQTEDPKLRRLKEITQPLRIAITEFAQVLEKTNYAQWNSKKSIAESIIHMHCNRLFGINANAEKKTLAIANYLLQKKYHKLKLSCV